jgi:hypothetical protein
MSVNVSNPLSTSYLETNDHMNMEVETGDGTNRPARVNSHFSGLHGHGLGIGEIEYDYGDEPNGCDRCGCPDEQVSC